jgi:hypothetical protein
MIAVVAPALDEAANVETLVAELRGQPVDLVIVVDNGSTDDTSRNAVSAGAHVVAEPRRGYGYACAAGTREAIEHGAEVIVYIDADLSSVPAEVPAVLEPILRDEADLVLGSRVLGRIEGGSMPPHQRAGNRISAGLMSRLYGVTVTDLGPFRAIRTCLLKQLDMQEMSYGWPTEMTVKSAGRGARIVEVPVTWRARGAGRSKVGGTVRGSVLAGIQITRVTFRHRRRRTANR